MLRNEASKTHRLLDASFLSMTKKFFLFKCFKRGYGQTHLEIDLMFLIEFLLS